jgi:hypothetical protein
MDFDSTEHRKAPRTQVCVVHDQEGRIVHGHVFVGDAKTGLFSAKGRAERERETLEGARRNHGAKVARLRVLHAPATFRFDPNVAYRVDVKAGRLVQDHGTSQRPATSGAAKARRKSSP